MGIGWRQTPAGFHRAVCKTGNFTGTVGSNCAPYSKGAERRVAFVQVVTNHLQSQRKLPADERNFSAAHYLIVGEFFRAPKILPDIPARHTADAHRFAGQLRYLRSRIFSGAGSSAALSCSALAFFRREDRRDRVFGWVNGITPFQSWLYSTSTHGFYCSVHHTQSMNRGTVKLSLRYI